MKPAVNSQGSAVKPLLKPVFSFGERTGAFYDGRQRVFPVSSRSTNRMSSRSSFRKSVYCIPLYLHRPALHYREAFWWSDVEMLPFKLVESAISCFELQRPIADLDVDTLLQFCAINHIEVGQAESVTEIAKQVVLWQIKVIEGLSCFQVTMEQFIAIYHCAKATLRRKTVRTDICQFIETTGEMSLEGFWSNVSIYVLTHFGIQQVLFIEFDRHVRHQGRFYTSTSSISSYADLPIWIEQRPPVDRQTFLAMVHHPNQFWTLKGAIGSQKRSAALYELEKVVWVLNTRLGDLLIRRPVSERLLLHTDVSLLNKAEIRKRLKHRPTPTIVLEATQPQWGEQVGVYFRGDDEWLYHVPLLWAGAIVFAYFRWARQVWETQESAMMPFHPNATDHDQLTTEMEATSLSVFDQWFDRLQTLLTVPDPLVETLQADPSMPGLPHIISNQLIALRSLQRG